MLNKLATNGVIHVIDAVTLAAEKVYYVCLFGETKKAALLRQPFFMHEHAQDLTEAIFLLPPVSIY